jgi:hypothetical protein
MEELLKEEKKVTLLLLARLSLMYLEVVTRLLAAIP